MSTSFVTPTPSLIDVATLFRTSRFIGKVNIQLNAAIFGGINYTTVQQFVPNLLNLKSGLTPEYMAMILARQLKQTAGKMKSFSIICVVKLSTSLNIKWNGEIR